MEIMAQKRAKRKIMRTDQLVSESAAKRQRTASTNPPQPPPQQQPQHAETPMPHSAHGASGGAGNDSRPASAPTTAQPPDPDQEDLAFGIDVSGLKGLVSLRHSGLDLSVTRKLLALYKNSRVPPTQTDTGVQPPGQPAGGNSTQPGALSLPSGQSPNIQAYAHTQTQAAARPQAQSQPFVQHNGATAGGAGTPLLYGQTQRQTHTQPQTETQTTAEIQAHIASLARNQATQGGLPQRLYNAQTDDQTNDRAGDLLYPRPPPG